MYGEYKVPGGKLAVIGLEIDQDALVDVTFSGDFFLDPDSALTRMAQTFEGACVSVSVKEIAELVEASPRSDDTFMGITPVAVGVAVRHVLGHALDWEDIDFEVIHGPIADLVVNITSDETSVKDVAAGRRRPFIRLREWNSPQVVIGSFQFYQNEVQPEGVEWHGTLVPRRATGGGAMFMEPGNCIICSPVVPITPVEGISFEQFHPFLDQWVMEILEKVGIKAKYAPLNNITPEVGKIGEVAQKRWSNDHMAHHVMMAYDIDVEKMNEVLYTGMEKIRDRGTCSTVKRIGPMRSQASLPREMILRALYNHFTQEHRATPSEITEADLAKAEERCVTKSAIEEWMRWIS